MGLILLNDSFFSHKNGLAYKVKNTTSTMNEARKLSDSSSYGLVLADSQSDGRGRISGRKWLSEEGSSLLASYWFPSNSFKTAPLPMITAIAVMRAIKAWAEDHSLDLSQSLKLKWPNDIFLNNKKLGGILCEASGIHIYAGIGLNCRQTSFEGEFRTEPVSLKLYTGLSPDIMDMAKLIAKAFLELEANCETWQNEYESFLSNKGQKVLFRPGLHEKEITAFLVGINAYGHLVLADKLTGEGCKAYPSGELLLLIDDKALP